MCVLRSLILSLLILFVFVVLCNVIVFCRRSGGGWICLFCGFGYVVIVSVVLFVLLCCFMQLDLSYVVMSILVFVELSLASTSLCGCVFQFTDV